VIEQAGKAQLREILGWNAGNQNRASLGGGGVGLANEILLANLNVMFHLDSDVVPNPYCDSKSRVIGGRPTRNLTREYPYEQQMSRITTLLIGYNIAENKNVKT
jgi:hypothetical protein